MTVLNFERPDLGYQVKINFGDYFAHNYLTDRNEIEKKNHF